MKKYRITWKQAAICSISIQFHRGLEKRAIYLPEPVSFLFLIHRITCLDAYQSAKGEGVFSFKDLIEVFMSRMKMSFHPSKSYIFVRKPVPCYVL